MKEKTLIVGAGDAGEQILRGIMSSKNNPYNPVGFVDDSPGKKGIVIHGFKVLGKISDIPKVVKAHQIKQLIVALPTAGSKIIKKAIELARDAGLEKIKIAPHINEIISGEISVKNLKELDEISTFNVAARYDIFKLRLHQKATPEYAKNWMESGKRLFEKFLGLLP